MVRPVRVCTLGALLPILTACSLWLTGPEEGAVPCSEVTVWTTLLEEPWGYRMVTDSVTYEPAGCERGVTVQGAP